VASEAEDGKVLLEFWSTDEQPERVAAYEAVAQRFMQAHPNVELRIIPKDEATISTELEAAAQENRLPALVRVGVERLAGLSQAGLLDEQAATSVLRAINLDDFRAGPLEMVTNLESQLQWAIPYDGWLQAIWYRKDLFDANSLPAPATWDQINQACDTLAASPDLHYALALPSDPTQNYGHQVFEQIALSNQAWPLAPSGEVTFNTPEMIEALRFYTALQRCSAPAPISVQQAADHYLRGEVAMLFYSTYIMDDLVEGAPREGGAVVMPSLPDLAQRTSFAAGMVGPRASTAYGQVVALAILQGADPLAKEAAQFFLTDGYVDVLATAPLGKVPTRQSVANRWTELSPIFANYSPATLGHIANGFDSLHRWALRGEYSNAQRAVISEIESRLLIPQAIDKILRGELTPESAAEWLQTETETLVGE
jgi:multiple sugar transport system substrate-binding protein